MRLVFIGTGQALNLSNRTEYNALFNVGAPLPDSVRIHSLTWHCINETLDPSSLENGADMLIIAIDATQPFEEQKRILSSWAAQAKTLNYGINLCLTNGDSPHRLVSDAEFRSLVTHWGLSSGFTLLRSTRQGTIVRLSSSPVSNLAKEFKFNKPEGERKNDTPSTALLNSSDSSLVEKLKTYIRTREEKTETYGWKMFSCAKYKKSDKINAAQFLINLIEGNETNDTLAMHQGALRQGELGRMIREFAVQSGYRTVRNLLQHIQTESKKSRRNAPPFSKGE